MNLELKDDVLRVTYDESSRNFEKDPIYNYMFLKHVESYLNELLHERDKHTVMLSEAINNLGFSTDDGVGVYIGSKVGWHDDGSGDTIIDFGLFNEENNDFIKGKTPVAILSLNTNMIKMS